VVAHETASSADLTEFTSLGKVPWEERAEQIRARFPTVKEFDWNTNLASDLDLFGRMVRDVLKLEQAVPGRPGPRPSLDVGVATRRLQQLWGNDYTIRAFPEALRILSDGLSVRELSALTGLNRGRMHRLLTHKQSPDGYELRACAAAFGKHPSYFLEWRILYITRAIVARLEWSPETTVDLFRSLDRQRTSGGQQNDA
jgi:hypothetical protein